MKKKSNIILVLFLILFFNCTNSHAQNNLVSFDVIIKPKIEKYKFLLEKPSLIVLALQNSGIPISSSKVIIIVNETEFTIGNAKLKYLNSNNQIVKYLGTINLSLGETEIKIETVINIDVSKLAQGIISINTESKYIKLIPEFVMDKILTKIQFILSEERIDKLNQYLAKKDNEISMNNKIFINQSLEKIILIDAYNKSNLEKTGAEDNNEGKSNQYIYLLLMITFLIIICIFLIFLIIKLKKIIIKNNKF